MQLTEGDRISEAIAELKLKRAAIDTRIKALEHHLEQVGEKPAGFTRGHRMALEWVARVYRGAVALGIPAKQYVANDMGWSLATAGRWIADARAAGLISPDTVDRRGRLKN